MYSKLRLAQKYLRYYLSSSNGKGHGMHSPFVFDFITKVLNVRTTYPAYGTVEGLRRSLLKNESIIEVEDLGAGSSVHTSGKRSVSAIAASTAKPPKYGQLLYRMVQYYKPRIMLELGTSLGLSGAYMALGNPDGTLTTIEGSTAVAEVAQKNFLALALQNVSVTTGNFDHVLPNVLAGLQQVDFCFIDGNHRSEPTLRYFEQLLQHVHNETILVFDDIHWSEDMEKAWEAICRHKQVQCTIDLFFIGIVLFRGEFREKQHFQVRF